MAKVHASLFSGFGAPDLAALWMGWDNAFWCETDDFCKQILKYWFPKSKGYGNIKETDFTPWRGKIDILTGGFPCQPFSVAGQRKGSADDRYLWPEMLRAIREIRPAWVIGENVAGILSMVQPGSEVTVESQASLFEAADKETLLEEEYVIETVCRSLEEEGYSVQPVVIPACAVGAPHRRDRVFFIAHRPDARIEGMRPERENTVYGSETLADSKCTGGGQVQQEIQPGQSDGDGINGIGSKWHASYTDGQMLQKWFQARRWPDSTKTPTGLDYGTERFGSLWDAPYANNLNGNLSGFCSGRLSQFEAPEIFENRKDWRDFPTQSPIHRRNDGLPFDVVCLTIPLTTWRTGAIKGYGNAIVPQVMYEIFKAIEQTQELKTFK